MTGKCKKVRCLVCNEILTYNNDDTSVLVDHLNLEHSGLDVFRFLAHCQVSSPKDNKRGNAGENCSMEAGDSDYGAKTKTYKTTVETWTPGPNCVVCPKCGKEGQPLIKKQRNKMAKSPLGALCMLGCWPFCFLPFLFRKEQFLDLYCYSCKYYLGTFDKRKQCMTRSPNRERIVGEPPPLYDSEEGSTMSSPNVEACLIITPEASYDDIPSENQKLAAQTSQPSPTCLPPSYSTVIKKKHKGESGEDAFTPRSAPPTYNDVPGVYVIPSTRNIERLYAIPSLTEPTWRSHSQPAYCQRCDVLVLTVTRTHESLATHAAALALCLFGCWPCCLLPYCLKVCKNTFHTCPICKSYLGAYTPWWYV